MKAGQKLWGSDRARRVVAAVGGLLCAGAVAALVVTDGGTGRAPVPAADDARTVAVTATETGLVCPVPAELDGSDVGDDQFDASPVETTTTLTTAVLDGEQDLESAAPPSVSALDGARTGDLTGPLEPGDIGQVRAGELTGGRVLHATPGSADYATGTTASVTTEGDLRGMVAGPCTEPGVDHWLVGGSTSVGSSGRLVLQNPGRTPASVTLEAWGPSGPVALGSQSLVVVPPGEQIVTMLEAVAPDQSRLSLHVTAEGGRVGATVQHHRIDGLVPSGADLVVGGAAPSSSVAVSGVVSTGEAVDDPHAPRLDLLAPGNRAGTARLSVLGPDGPVRLRGVEEVDLAPGRVTSLPLGGLPEGAYTVVVDADVPVVAGAAVDRQGTAADDAVIEDAPYDRAWLAGQAVSDQAASAPGERAAPGGAPTLADGAVAIPEDAAYGLVLSGVPQERAADRVEDAEGSTEVELRGVGPDGAEAWTHSVDVPTGQTVEVSWSELAELGDAVAVVAEQSPDEPGVVWSARLADADDSTLFSVLAPTGPLTGGGDVRVRQVAAVG